MTRPVKTWDDQDTLDQEIEMDELHNIRSEVASATEYAEMARMTFSDIKTRQVVDKSFHQQLRYLSLNN